MFKKYIISLQNSRLHYVLLCLYIYLHLTKLILLFSWLKEQSLWRQAQK